MLNYHETENNFLGITEKELYKYPTSNVVIQSAPYEYTSSYLSGSDKGPDAIIDASHFVEFYDEELDQDTYKKTGICTLSPLNFTNKTDKTAIDYIEKESKKLIEDKKFVISLGAEHTVTLGFFKAHFEKDNNIGILQIDAHSDLRQSYNGNEYSHASVMARIHDLGAKIFQVGIRAQCKEEAELIKNSDLINTWYAYQINANPNWQDEIISKLPEKIYITIDADGFDPSVIPAVGTAEPGGLGWYETLTFLKKVCISKEVVGFDIVECAPRENEILSQFNLAKLLYKLLGYCTLNNSFAKKYNII
ncbi:MAG: agmatinase [Bacteroidia bacterium]|nr:agmatinase [Bacteroidia bacterium]